jgi:hypothetical protein
MRWQFRQARLQDKTMRRFFAAKPAESDILVSGDGWSFSTVTPAPEFQGLKLRVLAGRRLLPRK